MQITHGLEAGSGLWVSLSELASMRSLSRQSVHERVSRLHNLGVLEVRAGRGRSRLVNVAQFDRAAGETVDAVRALNGAGAPTSPAGPSDPVLTREQARRVAYEADLKKLDLDERLAALLPVDDVLAAQAVVRERVSLVLERLPDRYAEDLAEVTAREGAAGARRRLKAIAQEIRHELAREMGRLADASSTDAAPSCG